MTGKSLLGTRLKQAREALEMTQEDLAVRLGIHRNTLSRYERGKLGISTNLLMTMAKLLKRPVSWFLSEETEEESDLGRSVIPQLIRQLEERYQEMELIDVPLLGTVPAGEPVTPEEHPREWISVPREEIKGVRHPRAFRVQGSSLESASMHDGDVIVVDPDEPIIDGEIYLVQIGHEATAKWIYRDTDRLTLVGDNGRFEVMEERRVSSLGKVIVTGGWHRIRARRPKPSV